MLRDFVTHVRTVVIAMAVAAVVSSCGGQQKAPTAPSSPAAPAAQPSAATGATIAGTVVGLPSSASQFKAQRISLTVSVTGTSVASTVDDNGRFTLNNVPAGRIDLHFVGTGIDAHLQLNDIAERATVVIVVRVSGNDARLEDRSGPNPGPGTGTQTAELQGSIAAGSLTGSCSAHTLSFMVGTTRVTTNASTVFKDARCESLKAGSRVEVKGTRQADNSIVATSVEGDEEDEDDNEVELKGTIDAGSLSGSCASNSLAFKVNSKQVRTNASTQFRDAACSSLKAGDSVEVKGTRQADASVLASRVERKK